ncbi:hypothetical protein FJ872_33005 [Mesorhizobium sp. B2-5-9]|uniref:hypothetical protein n=1 Tax=Mesorhizobium sp. B2-5-9 TaxID=2589921 RepID=UPI001126B606|nr:hypothetical protein [Mesorhizobium sp. B2-5-9]TPJ95598.1 hypothetical protein FJ872_33005 [Mesorhizobium sp. B2-5-9]
MDMLTRMLFMAAANRKEVTYIGTGAPATSDGTATSVGLPAGIQVNDILLLSISSSNTTVDTDGTVSTPAGWSIVANSPQSIQAGSAGCRLSVFWRRATGSDTAPSVSSVGHLAASISAFRGCPTTGNPWDTTAGDTVLSSSTVTMPSVTTTKDKCMVVLVVANTLSGTSGITSGYTNANLTGLAELADVQTNLGGGGGVAIAAGVMLLAGATGTTSATVTGGNRQGRLTISLQPG